jgi:hypothetical protein
MFCGRVRYVLVYDTRGQTSLGESETDTNANELFISEAKADILQQQSVIINTYVLTNPMDSLEKKRVSFGGFGNEGTVDLHHDSPQDLETTWVSSV